MLRTHLFLFWNLHNSNEVGFDYVRGDIRWDMRTLVVYPFSCLIAGLLSGTFGIGKSYVLISVF